MSTDRSADRGAERGTAPPPRTVPAQWALVSKRLDPSGTHAIDGYEVVGTSGSMAFAQSLQQACLTGTPSSAAVGTADALPWVTVTGGGGERPIMALSLMTSSALRTEAGRPLTPTRILWTEWSDAARFRMSWTAIAVAHQSMRWKDTITQSQPQHAAVTVQVADIATASVATDVDRFGFEWVAGLAGLVLEGRRIAIVAEETALPGLQDRLKLFDAVCALLPYGCRARFSAATWAKANVEHSVLLVFADAVAKDQHRVVWQAPLPRPRTADAVDYVEALVRLRRGDATFSTLDIVNHLLKEPDPGRCGDADSARRCLLHMDLAREVGRLIQSGRGNVVDVQGLLAEHPLDRLPSDIAQTVVQFLADRIEKVPAAQDVLVRHWSAEIERRLGAYGRLRLTAANVPQLLLWFDVAGRAGGPASVFALLREMLRPTDSMPDLPPASADAATRLLSGIKGAVKDETIQRAIVDQPTVCVALLRRIVDHAIPNDRAVEQIEQWLLQSPAGARPWLVPFGFAIGREEPTAEQWRALRDADDRVWLVLLHIAAFVRQSERVFASMWPHLVERAARKTTPAADKAFNADLDVLVPARCGLPATEWARIDILHLIRFGRMPGVITEAVPFDLYGETFRATWYGPALAARRADLNERLVGAIFPRAGTPMQAAKLIFIVSPNDPDLMHLAARAIAQEIDARPAEFDAIPFQEEWIKQIRHFSTSDAFWVYQEVRALAGTEKSIPQIADLYAHGRQIGLSPADLDRGLYPWILNHSPESIRQLLLELWRNNYADEAENLRHRIATGKHGPATADGWNTYIHNQHLFAHWLAGKGGPPGGALRPAPKQRRDHPAHGGASSQPTAEPGVIGKLGAKVKKVGSSILPHKNAGGDEHPAADHG